MERTMPLNACRWDRLCGILDWGSLKLTLHVLSSEAFNQQQHGGPRSSSCAKDRMISYLVSIAVDMVNFPPASTASAQILLDLWVASSTLGCLASP